MKLDQQVVDAIFKALFVDNAARYRQSLGKPADAGTDVYARARRALDGLDTAQKEEVFKFIELAIADTASVILGTLDGSHVPDDIDDDFVVTYKGKEIQGDMQGIFIGKAEDRGVYK